ncbi:MAG TPA: mannose-1-phosphate guanylyltransferase [Alphaproteobacteria bacterium]|nr:mannose-1-phosphate guanylyltransferase [Alphaproteobacteria bacterium]HNS44202.1 mannose-1-phosphate guanylyltransferase [Alphaproteobacteria bacterium]
MPEIIPVILCGGAGTRLWPLSREEAPKQFLDPLATARTLLQDTARRALGITGCPPERLVTVTLATYAGHAHKQLSQISEQATHHIVAEPDARNTAAAIARAILYCEENFGKDTDLWILPSDHKIEDETALNGAYEKALETAEENLIVTFGITPTHPETGYGYIQKGDGYNVKRFVEKPDQETAQSYIDQGDFLWNSGMFLFNIQTGLDEFETHAPDILNLVRQSQNDPSAYFQIPKIPFDVAIMEKTQNRAVIPCDPEWTDIGSWENLLREKSNNENWITSENTSLFLENKDICA